MANHLLLPTATQVGSRRAGGGGSTPPPNRSVHGHQLRGELDAAITTAAAIPRRLPTGVDPSLVFKLHASRRPNESLLDGRNLQLLGETTDYTLFVLSPDSGTALAQAIDSYQSTGNLSSLLDIVNHIELYGPDDRRGPGLENLDLAGSVQVDIKIWASNDGQQAQARANLVLQVVEAVNGQIVLQAISARRTVLRVTVPGAALPDLLNLSVIEQIRTPPVPFLDFRDWWNADAAHLELISIPGQVVGVLDDLPAAEHPLLTGLIDSVDSIGPSDYPWQLPGHHGTEVVGRVLYPLLHEELRDVTPLTAHGTVRIARILEPDPHNPDQTRFATSAHPHELVEEGIRLLHDKYGVKIFNLSVGYRDPFADLHVSALTEAIDDLIRELDIVVVVPTGNASFYSPASTASGHHVADDYPHYLDTPEHRLCEPGPAALAVTVGSVALSEAPAEFSTPRLGWQIVAEVDRVSPFSRTGAGTGANAGRLNKPDFVHYGGNTAVNDIGHIVPNEPGSSIVSTALRADSSRLFAACNGTSYAAPAVARVAADIADSYPEASANLIRALLTVGSTGTPQPLAQQIESRHFARYGHGLPTTQKAISSGVYRATMTFDGAMPVDTVSIHPVPMPDVFRLGRGRRRTVTISLAFDPPVRHQRREYLAARMQMDLYRQTSIDELQDILKHQPPDDQAALITDSRRIDLRPGSKSVRESTLQMRTWSRRNSFVDDDEIFYLVITHTTATWARSDPDYADQRYALAVTLEDEHLVNANLHQMLSHETRLPARVRIQG